jgi:hypothetical protein
VQGTHADFEAYNVERARVAAGGSVEERLPSEEQRALAALRTQLTQVAQEQQAMARTISKLTTKLAKADRAPAAEPVQADTANLPAATPEEEVKRADAQVQAQVDLIEDTLFAEASDPTWTDAAEQSLQDVFQLEEGTGFHLVHTECRTTLCRLELSLDGSLSPEESFHHLVHLMPWPGQSFVHFEDGESATAVVYLTREGHALPQAAE